MQEFSVMEIGSEGVLVAQVNGQRIFVCEIIDHWMFFYGNLQYKDSHNEGNRTGGLYLRVQR